MSASSQKPYVESLPPSVMALAGGEGMGGDWVMTLGSHEGGQGPSKELHGAHPLSCPLKMEEGRSAPGRGSSPKPATLDPHLSLPASRHPEPPAPPRPAVFGSSTQAGTAGGGCTIIRYAASRVTSSIHGGRQGQSQCPLFAARAVSVLPRGH